jgi:hypothetical protein
MSRGTRDITPGTGVLPRRFGAEESVFFDILIGSASAQARVVRSSAFSVRGSGPTGCGMEFWPRMARISQIGIREFVGSGQSVKSGEIPGALNCGGDGIDCGHKGAKSTHKRATCTLKRGCGR